MRKKLLLSFVTASFAFSFNAQIVSIPDANFKAALVGNTFINTNNDSEIQVSEAQAVQGNIIVPNLNISDLTGIEAFINITGLSCFNNALTTLNLSSNTALTNLQCGGNLLTSLNLSANTNLQDLVCSNNLLTSIDISANTQLTGFGCGNNQITALDISNNTLLSVLDCSYNQIGSLNLSGNTALTKLYVSENDLTILDIRQNALITIVTCDGNQLNRLYLNNGNNTNFELLWASNNPDLSCIQVDDAAYSNTTWINGNINFEDPFAYDSGVTFSENCNYTTGSNELTFELNSLAIAPNPTKDNLTISTSTNTTITIVNLLGEQLMKAELSAGENQIQTENFVPGVYLINTTKGQTIRFVKL